ncbi:extracellular solute-binding protein [Candidatus Kuenenbacteria bacterium]|nr:extracellular solute-binding protein [Candidatus Kuenenbacteria bacterium]
MLKQKLKVIIVFSVACLLVFSSTACTKGSSSTALKAYKPVTLVWWRVWDDGDAFDELITAYRKQHPNVNVEYKKLRYDEYERELIDALAEDRGPDIFSIHNTWTQRYKAKLLPLPTKTTLPIKYLKGTVKKEEVVELISKKALTPAQIRKKFLDPVAEDVVMLDNVGTEDKPKYQEKVWALPVSLDTLALYYNKDILSNAGVIEPPQTWTEFQEQVKEITKIDETTGNIQIAGAAIGTADNVVRNFDILSLLMMQNMTPMIDDKGDVVFNKIPTGLADLEYPPGQGALEYYTQFASPLYEGYTWNDKMPDSLTAFIQGKVGYFFGYPYHRETIVAQAPKLNFDVAGMPQVGENQKVNYANYWVEGVSKKTKVKDYAWDFVQFITDEANVEMYLNYTKKPTALRSTKIINNQLANEELTVFADQLLTAKSWYHGYNSTAAEEAFAEMINAVLSGEVISRKALMQAVEKVNYSIYK